MDKRNGKLKVKADKLGTVEEVIEFLSVFQNVYKSIYAFEFIVQMLENEHERNLMYEKKRFNKIMDYWGESSGRRRFWIDPKFYEIFSNEFNADSKRRSNLLDLQNQISFDKLILPSDSLKINKVNIQSPGFWEFLGSLNPLQQIREYLKDRHERIKDKNYRSRQEEQIGELEITEKQTRILNGRIETLKSLGFSDIEIRQMVNSLIQEPLNRLNKFQDNGQIETPEE
ncbi:hypothetical protein [Marinirhabdus gelatinilytica]|uniref:Uncharacterized protein n=1 Tax=Marinirhabdus gelatinilytica TaxID=1703343 RepID=A0A370Q367_9FLAO|nr:hypothetical protein [Marinirhabdus gelatinilytica]RDK82776.1 hypothetical protein C8D94_1135 [Marinirhabdus gelatinilytica]